MMNSDTLLREVQAELEDAKGEHIRVLNVESLTPMTEHMIFVTGTSSRHVKALANNLVMHCKQNGVQPLGVEGLDQGEWVLVDLVSVVVHIMQPDARAFYQLEKLWDVRTRPPEEELSVSADDAESRE